MFKITEDHLKLLRRMELGWQNCEYGAPEVDPKRPYGNSDVENDILEILDLQSKAVCASCGTACEKCIEDGEAFDKTTMDYVRTIHKETLLVLKIGLQLGKFEVGQYEIDVHGLYYKIEPF